MAVIPITFPNHYTLVVEISANDGLHMWRNSIDIVSTAALGAPQPNDPVVTAFIDFLAGITRDDSTITRALLRNWSRGDQPFSTQAAIWVQVLSQACKNWGAGTAFPAATDSGTPPLGEIVFLLAKSVFAGTGKTGHMSIRNCYSGAQFTATAGGPPVLVAPDNGTVPPAVNAWADTKLGSFCTDNPEPRFTLVHYSAKDNSVFDSAMQVPVFERVSMHDISRK
jgi:hypothetical protein